MPMRRILTVISGILIPLLLNGASTRFFSVSDGMSNESVKAIYQDSSGYLWFGTKYGLNRFDGYEFRHFFTGPDEMSQKNDIVSLVPDGKGRLWIGTFDGVSIFDLRTDSFVNLKQECGGDFPVGVVVGIYAAPDASVWIATKQNLYRFSDGMFSKLDLFGTRQIRAMGASGDGYIIMDVEDDGIVSVNTRNNTVVSLGCNEDNKLNIITILHDDTTGTWLFADTDNILHYNRLSGRIERCMQGRRPGRINQIHCAVKSDENGILLGTDTGIFNFSISGGEVNRAGRVSLEKYRVMAILPDANGNVWAGSFSDGVCMIPWSEDDFCLLDINELDDSHSGVTYVEYSRGRLIVGQKDRVIIRDSLGHTVSYPVTSFPGIGEGIFEIYHMNMLRSGEIFIYVLNQGCFIMNPENGRISVLNLDIPVSSQIRSACEDANGKIWVAADNLTVADMQSGAINDDLCTNETGSTRYMLSQTLYLENNGDMFVGTRTSGLWKYIYDRHSSSYGPAVRFGDGLPEDANVVAVRSDKSGNIWVGTYNHGLYVFDAAGLPVRCFNSLNGMADNTVCTMIEDLSGRMWVSSFNSMAMVDLPASRVVRYNSMNGYPLSRNSSDAMCVSDGGRIFVGGDGVVSFDPAVMEVRSDPSLKPRISDVQTIDAHPPVMEFSPSGIKSVELGYPANSLVVKVSNLIFLHQQACAYAYLLSSEDADWRVINGNEIALSHLRKGKHVLRVKCTDEYGIWSDEICEVSINVLPPFWQTTFAVILYVVFALSIAGLLIWLYLRGKKAEYKYLLDKAEQENIEKSYRERMELFTQFSHELRTPLTLIKSPVEDMLSDDELPEKYRFTISQVSRNANKMLMLVNQLLDFRKIEHDSLSLKLSRIDCETFLSEQLSAFREMARKKDISLKLKCGFRPEDLWIDEDLFERVMANLLSNAIKNTPVGGTVIVGTKAGETPDTVIVYVKDNGIGISPEDQKHIFEPFFQVNRPLSGGFGSGIGLSLVKNVVSTHNGRVWVESRQRSGSTFYVELPLGTAPHDGDPVTLQNEFVDSVPELGASVSGIGNVGGRSTVLVVEDDEEMRQYVSSKLSAAFDVVTANEGMEAVRIADEALPDLIVSDVMMPNMDGIEFCSRIKNSVVTAHIPVILLTAKDQLESVEQGYDALADDYVLKPFNSKILIAKCESLISNRALLRRCFQQNLDKAAEAETGDPFIGRIIDIVKENLDSSELSISYLYKSLGMSRAQFFKKVKAVSDLSPNKIILNVKMSIAAGMLKNESLNVSEVAYATGFSDPSYFSRVFRSIYKVSPSEYKNNHD